MTKLSPNKRAFSIAELLVVAGIFALIMALTSLLFFSGRDAMEQSTEKVDTAGRSRRAMDSLTPLVASTVETGGFEAITVFDPTLEDLTDQCHMDLTTRENFLDSNYTPTIPFDATGPYYRFRVAYDPTTQEVRLHRLKIVPIEVDTEVAPRLIAHNVMGCRFQVLTVGTVGVTLQIKADDPDERRPDGVTTTTLTAVLAAPGNK
ncbi:MAG: type II secretion system protein [Candidatus Eremiobacteraeota bacterium]|nr:type II secretion system protein [Candidatus Eremiobacteraeota bacterium]